MTGPQLKRREELLARNDAVLDRWPQRTGRDFMREMSEVANGLEALAGEVDAAQGDRFERSRNWRFVGNAHFDLANARDLDLLRRAADAYKKAEALLVRSDNAIEKMKLDYSYGHALIKLSEAKDLALAQEARRRFLSALEIARKDMPAAIEAAETALMDADRILALLAQAEGMSSRMTELEEQIKAIDTGETAAPDPVPDPAALFGQLLDVYKKDIAAGKVSETRQQALDQVLSELGGIVQSKPTDVAGITTQASRVRELMGRMGPLAEQSSHAAPELLAGSRADAVWGRFSRLKLYLSRDMSRPHMGDQEQWSGMELYRRCGHADTFLHQSGRDDKKVRGYEADVVRQLASDVRAFSLRNHLTLISPAWPTSPSPQDPNAVFFSGSHALRDTLAKVCAKQKLKLLAQAAPKDFASSRWDQLRVCHVAVFDFTSHALPDPKQPIDLAKTGPVAAVSYELGIALTLGRALIVLAKEGQALPFDVDIEPIRLKGDGRDGARLADAVDDAIYGLQRGGDESSIPATHAYLTERFCVTKNFIVEQSLKLIDDTVARDPIKFRQFVEPVLGSAGADAPQVVFPAWPGSYPRPALRRCFHVTAFGPPWAGETMKTVAAACKAAKPGVEYIRGDQVSDPNIIRSIWDNLCQASHVVVDLTGLNANVALELGIAHTLGRNVLLVTQDSNKKGCFPSITKMRTHRYSVTADPGLKPLRDAIDRFLAG
jgi:hypothetical protein